MWIYLLHKIEIYLQLMTFHDTWVYRTIKQEFMINKELEQSTAEPRWSEHRLTELFSISKCFVRSRFYPSYFN